MLYWLYSGMFPQILRLRRRLLLRFFFPQNDDSWQAEYNFIHRNIVLGNFLSRKILKRIYRKHCSENFLFKAVCKRTGPVRKKCLRKDSKMNHGDFLKKILINIKNIHPYLEINWTLFNKILSKASEKYAITVSSLSFLTILVVSYPRNWIGDLNGEIYIFI